MPKRNIFLYYLINICHAAWFVEAVWFFYWNRFASYTQIGLVFSFLTLIWILAEIPTGVFADKFGRKTSTILGCFLLFASSIATAFAPSIWWLAIAGIFSDVGRAFVSGALEALVYDDLKQHKQEKLFTRIRSTNAQLSIISFAVAVLIGGFTYPLFFRFPYLLTTLFSFVSFMAAINLHEVKISRQIHHLTSTLTSYFVGFQELFQKNLRVFLLPILIISVLSLLYDWGFSKPAMAVHFGFFTQGQSTIYTIMAISNYFVVGLVPRLRAKFGDHLGLTLLCLFAGLGFMISALNLGFWGIFPMLLIEFSGYSAESWISSLVNQLIDSRYRATTLSTLVILNKIPFLIINPLAGYMIDRGFTSPFHLTVGIIVITLTLIFTLHHPNPRHSVSKILIH